MDQLLECPACGARSLDLRGYDSMMLVRRDLGLFSMTCPSCGSSISAIQPLPPALLEEAESAAIRLNAGMGQNRRA